MNGTTCDPVTCVSQTNTFVSLKLQAFSNLVKSGPFDHALMMSTTPPTDWACFGSSRPESNLNLIYSYLLCHKPKFIFSSRFSISNLISIVTVVAVVTIVSPGITPYSAFVKHSICSTNFIDPINASVQGKTKRDSVSKWPQNSPLKYDS